MKVRDGFVSNSSSCSFVINKKDLTEEQIEAIVNHAEIAKVVDESLIKLNRKLKKIGLETHDFYFNTEFYESYFGFLDKWRIVNEDNRLILGCIVDNFNMYKFLDFIGVDMDQVKEFHNVDLTFTLEGVDE